MEKLARCATKTSFDENDPRVGDEFDQLVKKSALNETTLVKSTAMDIAFEVVEPEEPQMMPELRRMAAALAA